MRVLVYGHAGWIGQKCMALITSLDHVALAGKARVDETRHVQREIQCLEPDRVVCCIGRTHGAGCGTIDYLEQPGKLVENVRDNLFAPVSLALTCQAAGVHLTYLGTGCIFSYDDKIRAFTEDHQPNFFGSSYSVVKGFTDRLCHQLEDSVLNVRIRMPITDEIHPRNFITKITKYEKICSIPNSMTVLDDLLPIMLDACLRKITGTLNLCNPGVIEHNDILQMYRDHVDPAFTWANFSIREQDQVLAAGRSNNCMDTARLQRLYPDVPDIRTSVEAALRRMARRRETATGPEPP